MNRRFYLSLVLMLLSTVLHAGEWKPFLAYDMAREHSQAMTQFTEDLKNPKVSFERKAAVAFWSEIQRHHQFSKQDEAINAKSEDFTIVECEVTSRVTLARISSDGSKVSYHSRNCKAGERIVYFKGRPIYSLYCGNPILPKKVSELVVIEEVVDDDLFDCERVVVPAASVTDHGVRGNGYSVPMGFGFRVEWPTYRSEKVTSQVGKCVP